jgi:hypothetical protein
MSSPTELLALYQEWLQLTGAETRAIAASAWEQVGEVQSAKALLQPAIRRLSVALKGGAVAVPEDISQLLAELISCERANQDMVGSQLAAARAERAALGESASRLRDIRRAYVLNAR